VLRALLRHEQWNVGIVDAPISCFLSSNNRDRVRWLPGLARSEFRADPFGLIRDGRLIVLCEQLDYHDFVGKIVAIDVSNNAVTPVSIGPTPSVHMSYPFLLELEGHTFCVPETCAAAEIGLYQAEHFPDRWRKTALLAPGSGPVVDATLFRHEGRWWLAAGPYPDGLHTLSAVGNVTLIDSKRLVFMAPEFRRVLRHFVTQALGLRR
jgi:hypothetical protein